MKQGECIHAWIGTRSRTGDSHRCISCGLGIRCTCDLHFNAFSPVHAQGCPMRRVVAGA
jgi:hypothetical protein